MSHCTSSGDTGKEQLVCESQSQCRHDMAVLHNHLMEYIEYIYENNLLSLDYNMEYNFLQVLFFLFSVASSTGSLFRPPERILSGTDLEVIFGNAKVDFGIKSLSRFCRHFFPVQRKRKFLLIHCRRRKQSRLHTAFKPIWHRSARLCHFLDGFGFMGYPLCFAIADRNNNAELFSFANGKR